VLTTLVHITFAEELNQKIRNKHWFLTSPTWAVGIERCYPQVSRLRWYHWTQLYTAQRWNGKNISLTRWKITYLLKQVIESYLPRYQRTNQIGDLVKHNVESRSLFHANSMWVQTWSMLRTSSSGTRIWAVLSLSRRVTVWLSAVSKSTCSIQAHTISESPVRKLDVPWPQMAHQARHCVRSAGRWYYCCCQPKQRTSAITSTSVKWYLVRDTCIHQSELHAVHSRTKLCITTQWQ
jgi:hypothetical protein